MKDKWKKEKNIHFNFFYHISWKNLVDINNFMFVSLSAATQFCNVIYPFFNSISLNILEVTYRMSSQLHDSCHQKALSTENKRRGKQKYNLMLEAPINICDFFLPNILNISCCSNVKKTHNLNMGFLFNIDRANSSMQCSD